MFFISLMLILPFLFPHHPNPIPTFYMEWLTALFALLAFLPLLKQTAWPAYQVPTIIVLPLAMLVVMVAQYIVLDIAYWQHYFLVAQYFVFAALMMLLGAMLKQAMGFDKVMKAIAIALLISGLLSTVVVALDLANINLGGWIVIKKGGGAIANIGQSNHLATLLSLALASLGYLYVRRSIKPLLAWPLVILILAGLALTASRSTWIYVCLLPVTALIYCSFSAKNTGLSEVSNKRLVSLLIFPLLYFFTQLALPYMPTNVPISTTNQRLVELAQTKNSPRLLLYKASWYVFTDNPIFGTGFGQMAGHDLNHTSRVPQLTGTISQAHNMVLQLLAETGVIGTTLVLVCLLAYFVRAKSAPLTPERWLWWLFLLIIGTHAMLEYPLWYLYFLAPASLLLGLGDLQTSNITKYRPQFIAALLSVIWLSSLMQTVYDYRVIEAWFHQNQKVKLTVERFDLMVMQLQPIRLFSPFASQADVLLLSSLPVDKNEIQAKLNASKRLIAGNYTPAVAYTHATLLALNGELKEAKKHLINVHIRHPSFIDTYWTVTVDQTLKGAIELFHLVKHIELLRDGEDPTYQAPNLDDFQFKKPALEHSISTDTSVQG
ncbi:MAG: Wzy polymerase domain-containing protein [Methylophilus sp.]|nr:Wzy polymerase domain-containing protein [Methylophilus sp.]